MMEDRYYVQCLTAQIFVVRERLSVDGAPGPNDRYIRAFDMSHDAYVYVQSVNDTQKKLDEQHGHWAEHAI